MTAGIVPEIRRHPVKSRQGAVIESPGVVREVDSIELIS